MTLTIRLLLEEKLGRRIRYPKDCDGLAVEISKIAGDRLSPSTLKRIFGFITPGGAPSLYTLDVISKFLGYLDWEDLQAQLKSLGDSHFLDVGPNILRSEDISEGYEFEIGYSPERKILLLCIGKATFRVLESENSSLCKDDIVVIHLLGQNYPLIVNSIHRDDKILGPWIAAKSNGIDYIRTRKNGSGENAG